MQLRLGCSWLLPCLQFVKTFSVILWSCEICWYQHEAKMFCCEKRTEYHLEIEMQWVLSNNQGLTWSGKDTRFSWAPYIVSWSCICCHLVAECCLARRCSILNNKTGSYLECIWNTEVPHISSPLCKEVKITRTSKTYR